jgi:hypothetical protein
MLGEFPHEANDPACVADLAQAPWRATNHVAPHEYIVEHWTGLQELVDRVRSKIREEGYWRYFRGHTYPTVHLGEHYYWTMRLDYPEFVDGQRSRPGGPVVLNRALLPPRT